ncbi:sensor histidine kinase [Paraliomyxa miuraensis]|uniref:sensor histidine kinase n=1 Tax=Paraliomyxa miuraensis TaxID=376150 RepID=UPI002251E534|nr:HAMP domain-containing sensor histidine kinase [Paraliomyxa miuraensis]
MAVALSVALLVGWILVIYRNQVLTRSWEGNAWLMIAGIISFVTIMTVLVLFSVFLAREIREVRRQTSFIDSVTHELRSPLASLRLCLETQAREGLQPAQRQRLREMMLDDIERLSAFVDDILESNRLAHGQDARPIEAFELEALVQRSVATVTKRHHIEQEPITVEVPQDMVLHTDPVALELVLRNLLDNAVKYSDPPRAVRLRATVDSRHTVSIEVEDDGVGIPKADLKRVFERFYRVDDEAVRTRRGTGLGLFVVASLVRGLGGRLRAHSPGPGKGTCMVVTLPSRVLHSRTARSPSTAEDAPT